MNRSRQLCARFASSLFLRLQTVASVNGWLDGMALALYDIVSAANEWGHPLCVCVCVCVCVCKSLSPGSKRTHSLYAAESARGATFAKRNCCFPFEFAHGLWSTQEYFSVNRHKCVFSEHPPC
jgi:hypothetical protein